MKWNQSGMKCFLGPIRKYYYIKMENNKKCLTFQLCICFFFSLCVSLCVFVQSNWIDYQTNIIIDHHLPYIHRKSHFVSYLLLLWLNAYLFEMETSASFNIRPLFIYLHFKMWSDFFFWWIECDKLIITSHFLFVWGLIETLSLIEWMKKYIYLKKRYKIISKIRGVPMEQVEIWYMVIFTHFWSVNWIKVEFLVSLYNFCSRHSNFSSLWPIFG